MKNTIINILIFILAFNIMMIIFPEGKTQKYCKLTIKILIIIYIIDNVLFKGIVGIDNFLENLPEETHIYEREINIKSFNQEFIDLINENNFNKEEVIVDIVLNFTEDMNIKAVVKVNKLYSVDEQNNIKTILAEILKISENNIEIDL
ncbi:MAG: hypothetical protein PHE29_11865 [Tissierellia bacterium]|nr:hypothetical protein [Tissierellia bacterium]MDD4780788.1 hypothetical protein [Tissierellia bacterium]